MYQILPKFQSKYDIIYHKYIPRRRNNAFFSGKLSTGIDPALNFGLVKSITKNIYTYYVKERWRDGYHQKGKIHNQ